MGAVISAKLNAGCGDAVSSAHPNSYSFESSVPIGDEVFRSEQEIIDRSKFTRE